MKKPSGGLTLVEMMIAMIILAFVSGMTLTFFVGGSRYYAEGMNQSNVQSDTLTGIKIMLRDLQESHSPNALNANPGIFVYNHNAILVISARDAGGNFRYDPLLSGQPYWTQWVAYYLTTQNGVTNLVRQAGNPLGLLLPSITIPSTVPPNWLSLFQSASLPTQIVAQDVKTFDVEDVNCSSAALPLYIQLIASKNFGDQTTNYNTGDSASDIGFSCVKSGYWFQVNPLN